MNVNYPAQNNNHAGSAAKSLILSLMQWGYFLLWAAGGFFCVMAVVKLVDFAERLPEIIRGQNVEKALRSGSFDEIKSLMEEVDISFSSIIMYINYAWYTIWIIVLLYLVLFYCYLRVSYCTQSKLVSDGCQRRMLFPPSTYILGVIISAVFFWVLFKMGWAKINLYNFLSGDKSAVTMILLSFACLGIMGVFFQTGRNTIAKKLSYYAQQPAVMTVAALVSIMDILGSVLFVALFVLPFTDGAELLKPAFLLLLVCICIRWVAFLILLELFRQAACKIISLDISVIQASCGLMPVQSQVQVIVQNPVMQPTAGMPQIVQGVAVQPAAAQVMAQAAPVASAAPAVQAAPAPAVQAAPVASAASAAPAVQVAPVASAAPAVQAAPVASAAPAPEAVKVVPDVPTAPVPEAVKVVPDVPTAPAPEAVKVVPDVPAAPVPEAVKVVPDVPAPQSPAADADKPADKE